ncbi:MAG: RtcB family protein [Deltaproteobacteria bacterium]|nr:RtcB family protein [Deltaproteobacteria bacterium]
MSIIQNTNPQNSIQSNTPEVKYETLQEGDGLPVKAWIRGVPVENTATRQLHQVASMPFVHGWVAVMPDCHVGKGATIGSVIPTHKAIIPAAVGVDLGCGMMATRTSLTASDLPNHLKELRANIEAAVPHGRNAGNRRRDKGSWGELPGAVENAWLNLKDDFDVICAKHRAFEKTNNVHHLGTLGTGNHFIEVCLDEEDRVWFMLHSGSRGVGNRIGTYFIGRAQKDMGVHLQNLPSRDLAYLEEGTTGFDDYVQAVGWAQRFARENRELMMKAVLKAAKKTKGVKSFTVEKGAVNCHHNYVQKEHHFGADVWLTRKGAVRAGEGELGIIPGSMGARSFIVRGKGNPDSFCSCSHGAGRVMSRTEAKNRFTLDDHRKATAGVECRKDSSVIDETPAAYKDIDAVMRAQSDLVDVVHTLRQVVCVKG